MELVLYWKIVKKRLWLIVVCTVLAATSAYLVGAWMRPVYSTSATLLVQQAPATSPSEYSDILASERLARTYTEMLTGRPMLEVAIAQLELEETPDKLAERVKATLVRDTQLIRLGVEDSDPVQAAGIANAIAEAFIAHTQALQAERYAESLDNMQVQIAALSALTEHTEARIDALGTPATSQEGAELANLETILAGYRSTYASLQQNYEQMRLTAAQSTDNVILFETAQAPERPVRPRRLVNTALAAAVGAMLALGVAFLLEFLDWTIKTPEELDAIYGLNTLGVIGTIKGANRGKAGPPVLVTMTQPNSPIAETFRALRTNLRFASPDHPVRSLLITSAGPLEGKTLTASNLAVVLAQGGQRVLLVDTDLRRPSVHVLFDVAREPGFSSLVLDQPGPNRATSVEDIDAHVQATWMENLRVLTCGPVPRRPAELLSSYRAAEVMMKLQDYADIVIYDSPPAATVTDAAILASRVDAVVQVVKAGGTRRDVVLSVKSTLEKVGGRVLGPVLNQVSPGDMGYYSYYYYGYYHDEDDREKEKEPAPRHVPSLQQGRSPAAIAATRLGTQIESESGQAEP